ncbi:MAG: hypothetical protein MUE54_04970, partial [Anaerolineae bacterium]|nr:hypothetical protein [Anaerolineae bacterium]
QQYHCKDCGAYRVLKPKQAYSQTTQETVLKACKERVSLGGITRIFGMSRQTVAGWIKRHAKHLPLLVDTLLPSQADDNWMTLWFIIDYNLEVLSLTI